MSAVNYYSPLFNALQDKKSFTILGNKIIPTFPEDLDRFPTIAAHLSTSLREEQRLPPEQALEHLAVTTTSCFLKTVPESLAKQDAIKVCRKERLAFCLGIPSIAFDQHCNQGFENFATKPPLAPYLAFYKHRLQIDPKTLAISILYQGALTPWKEVKNNVVPPLKTPIQHQPWTYSQSGAQYKDTFIWSKLEPYKITQIGHQSVPSYEFRICSCVGPVPRFGGDHSWIELISREDNLEKTFSFGLFSPYGMGKTIESLPLRVQPAFLMSPDVSRWFLSDEICEVIRPITKDQLNQIIDRIEKAKKNQDQGSHIPIQLTGNNCTRYALSVAEDAGIEIPSTKCHIYTLLAQTYGLPEIEPLAQKIDQLVPNLLSKCLRTVAALPLNYTLLLYGAGATDKAAKGAIPHFTNLLSIADLNKGLINHPWGVKRIADTEIKQQRNMPESALPTSQ